MAEPKLRFKREDGTSYPEWEEKKIGDLTKTFSASRVHKDEWQTEGVPFWRSSDVMAFHQRKDNSMGKAFITNELYQELSNKSGKMQKDDILITGGGSIGIPYLIPNDNPLYVKDADLLCIQKSDKHNSQFLYQYFWSPSFRNYLRTISHKGTIAHYTITQINDTPITIPIDFEEQQKIADFFSDVDEVIAQSEAEVQNLEQQKKAAMQKIFSQEVRFKREDGAEFPEWEEKILQDISCYVTVTGTGTKDSFIGTENMQKGCAGITFENDTESMVKGTSYRYNDVLVSNIRPYLKKAWKADRNGICSTDVLCIRGNSIVNSDFLYTIIANDSFFEYVMQGAKGTKMPRGDKKHIMDMPVSTPCLEEQQKIADFLFAYDEAISYAKQELDKWKKLKKGLLQQMFI